MAYDPEARETSNSALIIGIVALVLVVGGLLAYYATRPNETATAPIPIVQAPGTTIIKEVPVAVPGAPAPPVVVESPVVVQKPVVVPGTTRIIERSTTSNTTRVVPGTTSSSSAPATRPSVNTNVTINNPPFGTRAGNSATSGTTSSSSTSGADGVSGAQEDAAASTAENTATNSAGY